MSTPTASADLAAGLRRHHAALVRIIAMLNKGVVHDAVVTELRAVEKMIDQAETGRIGGVS